MTLGPSSVVRGWDIQGEALAMPADAADTPVPGTKATARLRKNERRHPRFACDLAGNVMLLQSSKPLPVGTGKWCRVRVVDVSEGGAQIRTPWPLSLNDLLLIDLPVEKERKIKVKARVVHVRRASDSTWAVGLRFVDDD